MPASLDCALADKTYSKPMISAVNPSIRLLFLSAAFCAVSTLVACGGGGSSSDVSQVPAPSPAPAPAPAPTASAIPVRASSYENKVAAAEAVGSRTLPIEVVSSNSAAYADFFQEGQYSLITHSLVYRFSDRSTINQLGSIRFYKFEGNQWVDRTSNLLTDTTGCLHPRKAVVADFNQDGKPDVFFACHGFDAAPFPGEQSRILLSQADGKYRNAPMGPVGFFHGATAADVSGDGYPDILVTDFISTNRPFFHINNRDGTFTVDATRLPAAVNGQQIFSAELIDLSGSGKRDLILAGHEQSGTWPATILRNDGADRFASAAPVVIPSLPGYGYAVDMIFVNGNFYLSRTSDALATFYKTAAIQRVRYPSMESSAIYTHTGPYPGGVEWINWIIPNAGRIQSMDLRYGVSVNQ